jgi:ABC-type dipeptide transport system, periplasmic component
MRKNTTKKLLALILTFSFIFTACNTNNNTNINNISEKNTFIYGIEADPGDNVNAITTANRLGMMVLKATYSPLFSYTELGTNWYLANDVTVSEDLRTYTFSLKEEVLWHDGEIFTADDVVFTFETMLSTPEGWANEQLTFGEEQVLVRKNGDYEVEFIFPYATPHGMELLSNIFIMPKHIYENEADITISAHNAQMIGTGPYILEEYKEGEYISFTANPAYFDGEPQIETLVFRIISEPATARFALQNGEIHAITAQATDIGEIQSLDGLSVCPYTEGRVVYLVFNTKHNLMQNENMRKAIMYALNRNEINEAAYISEEYYSTIYTFLPSGNPYTTNIDVELYEQNLDNSITLLGTACEEENILQEEVTLQLAYWGANVPQQRQAAVIQQQLKDAGITIEIIALDPNALDAEMQDPESEYDMFLGGYIIGVFPGLYADMFTSSSVYNYSHIADEKLDQLFLQAAIETDAEVQYALYAEIQQYIQELGIFYPMADNKRILVINEAIGGIEDSGLVPIFTIEDFSKLYFMV